MDTKKIIEPAKPNPKDAAMGCFLAIVFLFGGVAALKSCTGESNTPSSGRDSNPKAVKAVEKLIKDGDIKKVRDTDYWVSPIVWMAFNRDQKEQFVRIVRQHCIAKKNMKLVKIRSYTNDEVLGQADMFDDGVTINR